VGLRRGRGGQLAAGVGRVFSVSDGEHSTSGIVQSSIHSTIERLTWGRSCGRVGDSATQLSRTPAIRRPRHTVFGKRPTPARRAVFSQPLDADILKRAGIFPPKTYLPT